MNSRCLPEGGKIIVTAQTCVRKPNGVGWDGNHNGNPVESGARFGALKGIF